VTDRDDCYEEYQQEEPDHLEEQAAPPGLLARIGFGTLAALLLTSGVYDLGGGRAGDGLVQLGLGAYFAYEALPHRERVPVSRGLTLGLVVAGVVLLLLRFAVRNLQG
jgi:hypothetical protein